MLNAESTIWFLKLATTSVLIVICCWVAPRFFHIPQFPPTTTDEQKFVVLNRYLQLPMREIVLVGSSLTFRLKEQFFERGNVRNVGLPGGESLTGLTIIESDNARRPNIVSMETNVLTGGLDNDLLQKVLHRYRLGDALRPLRSLAALYQSKLDLNQPSFDMGKRRAALAAPAVAYDNEKGIKQTLAQWNKQIYEEKVVKEVSAVKALVDKLEARGIAVFLHELPVPPALAQSVYLETTRKTLKQVFGPDSDRWLTLEYPPEELRWEDAIHLDERSAIIMSSSIENAISEKMLALQKLGRVNIRRP
jgi:hypothetical protein